MIDRTDFMVLWAMAAATMLVAAGCGSNSSSAPPGADAAGVSEAMVVVPDAFRGDDAPSHEGDVLLGDDASSGSTDAMTADQGLDRGDASSGGDTLSNGDAGHDASLPDAVPSDVAASPDGLPAGLKVIMVTNGAATPTAGDRVMRDRLLGRGFQVSFVSDVAVTAVAVAGQDLIVISSSAESGPLGIKIRDVALPILCVENGAFPTMGLTGTTLASDYGSTFNQTTVNIVANAPMLAGTLTGAVIISSVPAELGWAVPAPSAIVGATMTDNPAHAALFAYPAGSQMASLIAPARRVGFAIRETLAANLTPEGLRLFDSAVTFALARD